MITLTSSVRRSVTLVLVLLGLLVAAVGRPAAYADTQPPAPNTPATVSTDPLPTVQVDGVVWTQVVIGNTVYAGGSFATARPAGAAPRRQHRAAVQLPRLRHQHGCVVALCSGVQRPDPSHGHLAGPEDALCRWSVHSGGRRQPLPADRLRRRAPALRSTPSRRRPTPRCTASRPPRPGCTRSASSPRSRPRVAAARGPSTPGPEPCCPSRSPRPAGRSGTSWCPRTVRRWCSAGNFTSMNGSSQPGLRVVEARCRHRRQPRPSGQLLDP